MLNLIVRTENLGFERLNENFFVTTTNEMHNITIYNFTIKFVNYKIVYCNVVNLLIIV